MFKNINFEPGIIIYNDFYINPEEALEVQVDYLKEDLFQVNYLGKYIIDLGWYPEFNTDGSFCICVVQDYNWTELIFKKHCKDLKELNKYMQECVDLIKSLIEVVF